MALTFITNPAPEYVFTEDFGFRTLVSKFENGVEQRRAKISQGRSLFTLTYKILKREEMDRLYNFYRLCQGSYRAFNFTLPLDSMLPYDQTTIWLPLHEGTGTRVDDWNGYIYPTYSCRFNDDSLSYDEFSVRLRKVGLKLFQESPLSITNNYGTLTGGTWALCPDSSSCILFNGSSDYISLGDPAAADVGTGDFSFAFSIYPNSLASALNVISKKADSTTGSVGYNVIIATNGQITVNVSDGTHQNSLVSAAGVITNQTWKVVAAVIDRNGNCQIYVNDVASGSPVTGTTSNTMDNTKTLYLGRAEGIGYASCDMRNFLLAKKVWTQVELDKIWATWRGICQI